MIEYIFPDKQISLRKKVKVGRACIMQWSPVRSEGEEISKGISL